MRDKITHYLGHFLALLMTIMTIDVLWGVFTRYAMGNQASWSEELARFLLIWIGILGAAYASGQNMHLAIDLLSPKLAGKSKQRLASGITILIILFVFCILVIGGFRLIYVTQVLGQMSPALQIPMTVVYAVLPLSGIIIVYYKVHDLITSNSKI
jgi:TRAP-type C4-dicarboxylate transport system permease small subunit